ncbi:solute carrier family 23 protein, partial [Escherichia coli]|uniref:solute carrier family 23 protein n=1 Tax=Escherichia coli TaxID=562 RepID=UPI00237861D4
GIADPNFKIQLPPFALSVAAMCLVLGLIIFLPQRFARYGLLVGTIIGWLLWFFCFPSSHSLSVAWLFYISAAAADPLRFSLR